MKNKKWIYILITILIIVGCFSCFVVYMTLTDEFRVIPLPVKSQSNEIILTSNGCCLYADNIKILFMDSDGNKTVAVECDGINEREILKYEIPQVDYSPIYLTIELTMYYGNIDYFSYEILEFVDIAELKKNGLLVYVQEADGAYINVITGKTHISYKLLGTDTWEKQAEPKKIYALP